MSKKKHNTQQSHTRQKKKEQFQSTGGKSTVNWPFITLAVAVAMGMIMLYLLLGRGAGAASSQAVTSSDLRVPVSEFADGNARYYTYTAGGQQIGFFVVKSSDGIIRAAFNACDVCYKSRKGYVQQGDDMVCINCGKHFPSVSVNELKGGCNPAPLLRSIEGDQLVIRSNDLLQGGFYF